MSIAVQLAIGALMIALTILIHSGFIAAAFSATDRWGTPKVRTGYWATTALVAGATLWMLAALITVAWMWAGLFIWLKAFDSVEPALYFATVSLTTLGFGDIVLPKGVRLLSAVLAANGLIMFGLITAFLVEFVDRLREGGPEERRGDR